MSRTPALTGTTFALAAALGLTTAPAAAQDAAEILDRMLEEYETRAEGIDDYTMVQSFMGYSSGGRRTVARRPSVRTF